MPQFQVGNRPVHIFTAGDPPAAMHNHDLTNTVSWGPTQTACTSADASTLEPNAVIALTGDSDVWAVCSTVTPPNSVIVDLHVGADGFFRGISQGQGSLVIPSLHSPNFQAGVSGWTINKDGSAEFNNLVIRNGQIVSGIQLIYSTTTPQAGKLLYSVAAVGGTDSVGNVYLDGSTTYHQNNVGGSYFIAVQTPVITSTGNTVQYWTAATQAGPWTQQANIAIDNTGDYGIGANSNIVVTAPVSHIQVQGAFTGFPPEPWNPLTPSGSWTNVANQGIEIKMMPDKTVMIEGILTVPAGVTGPGNTMTVIPAAYRPATRDESVTIIETLTVSPFTATAHLGLVRANGNFDCFGAATAGNLMRIPSIRYALDG